MCFQKQISSIPGPRSIRLSQVYLRFESAINSLLLPVTRQRNRFCRDFREVFSRAQGLGGEEEKLLATIDASVKRIRRMSFKVVMGISWGFHGDSMVILWYP